MSLAPYRDVLRDRRVIALLLLGIAIRIPAASGLALTFYVVESLDRSYAEAGVIVAAFTVGAAVGAPWRGRRVDVAGLRRALIPPILIETSCFAASSFAPFLALIPLAFLAGLFTLPSFSVIRQSLAVLVPEDSRRTAFSLDSIGVEFSFMIGPALTVWVATAISPEYGLRAIAVLVAAAGITLWVFNPPTTSPVAQTAVACEEVASGGRAGHGQLEQAGTGRGRLIPQWFSLSLLVILATTSGAAIVLFGTDVSVFARLRAIGELPYAGLVLAVWSLGSIVGALVYGQLRNPPTPLMLLLGLAVLTAPVALATSVGTMAALVFVAGAACAPVITATAEAITRLVGEEHRGAALGWHGSALTLGGAIGGPYTGAAIDAFGPWAGPVAVAAIGAAIALLGLVAHRRRALSKVG